MTTVVGVGTDVLLARGDAPLVWPRVLDRIAAVVASVGCDELLDVVPGVIVDGLPIDRCEVVIGASVRPEGWHAVPLIVHGEAVGTLLLACDNGAVVLSSAQSDDLAAAAALVALAVHSRAIIAKERDRIAQDLHDSVGQLVIGIGLGLTELAADAPDEASRTRVDRILRLTRQVSEELRQAIDGLLHAPIDGGLAEAIGDLCRVTERRTGVAVEFHVFGTPIRVASAKEECLYRAAVEALVNVGRHAKAQAVVVELHYGSHDLTLVVCDDGVGLGHDGSLTAPDRLGIRTMQRRLEDAGGELRVSTRAQRGVRVEAVIPGRGIHIGAGTGGGRR